MDIEEAKKYIDKLLWFIPISKLRYFLRMIFYNILEIREIRYIVKELENEIRYINKSINKNIIFFKLTNYWERKSLEEDDFFKISKRILNKYDIKELVYNRYKPDIEIFSVTGDRELILKSQAKIKIFYTPEAVQEIHTKYNDNCINYCHLSVGFNHIKNNNYIRIPLWFLYIFDISNINKDKIKKILQDINNNNYKKSQFASMVASWNGFKGKLRTTIYNKLIHIDEIKCPGKLLHNDDTLKMEFNNNKVEYLKQFKFNICPENCIEDGYITEKIIEAFQAGCIPIWNGDKNVEGDVINKNAILYWEKDSDNKSLIKEIEKLNKDDKLYEKFIAQPRFNIDIAVDYIYYQINLLNNKMEELLLEEIINKL